MGGHTRVGVFLALIAVSLFVCMTGISAFHLGSSVRRQVGASVAMDTTGEVAEGIALAYELSPKDVRYDTVAVGTAKGGVDSPIGLEGKDTTTADRRGGNGPAVALSKVSSREGTDLSLVMPPRDPAPATRVPTPAMLGNRPVTPAPAARPRPLRAILTPAERELLAHLVDAEAAGEPYLGKVAVAAVVLNRLDHPNFPNTIEGVVFERGAFEPVANGRLWRGASPRSYQAVDDALRGLDPTNGALYFYNPHLVSPDNWIRTRQVIQVIGRHYFAI